MLRINISQVAGIIDVAKLRRPVTKRGLDKSTDDNSAEYTASFVDNISSVIEDNNIAA